MAFRVAGFRVKGHRLCCCDKWGFPKIRGTLFWGPYNKDPTIQGIRLGSPIFGSSQICDVQRLCPTTKSLLPVSSHLVCA